MVDVTPETPSRWRYWYSRSEHYRSKARFWETISILLIAIIMFIVTLITFVAVQ